MKRKVALVLTMAALLLSFLLVGCGVAPEKYDQMAAQLQTALSKIAEMRGETDDLTEEKEAVAAELVTVQVELEAAQVKVAELESQVSGLKEQVSGLEEQYGLVGATPAETAESIVRNYFATHTYEANDVYDCNDMSSDVWNQLKAKGLKAVIAVGGEDSVVNDIMQSNHAWVLAEVGPGEYLALETTAGFVATRNDELLYYTGWYFDTPLELKQYEALRKEYNVRVGIHNEIVEESHEVLDEYNQATNQTTADKLEAVYNKLIELIEAQEAELDKIKADINDLAKPLSDIL